jgi:hypothetical protein
MVLGRCFVVKYTGWEWSLLIDFPFLRDLAIDLQLFNVFKWISKIPSRDVSKQVTTIASTLLLLTRMSSTDICIIALTQDPDIAGIGVRLVT